MLKALFHRKKLTNVIIWGTHEFSHQFPTVMENVTKPIVWRKSGKLIFILFPSYGIFHHMGNAWVSTSISHSTGKCNKTHRMCRAWEIGTHTFLIVRVFFSPLDSCFMIYFIHMGNACVFSSIFHNVRKDSQTHQMGKLWEIGLR